MMDYMITGYHLYYEGIGNKTVSSDSVCNHTREKSNRTSAARYHSNDNKPNWTSLSPIIIAY